MTEIETSVEFDFSDGFLHGYFAGMMMGSSGCHRDDCPKTE